MIIIRGVLKMLQMADSKKPQSFSDFTKILIGRKRLSSATVSKRLGELVRVGAFEEMITKSDTGRKVIAYKTTERGKKIIKLAKELEQALEQPTKK